MNILQQVHITTSTRQSNVLPKGISPENLISDPLEITDISELTQDNQLYKGMSFLTTLDQKFAREVAILSVESEGTQYRVRCRSAVQVQCDTELTSPPELSYAQQMQGENIAIRFRQILGQMRQFAQKSYEARKIRGWLIQLRKKLKQEFAQKLSYIVINDNTGFEIPWEMLELSENEYLGASIVAVRWQDIQNPDLPDILNEDLDEDNKYLVKDNESLALNFDPCDCCGEIVVCANTNDLEAAREEVKFINKFKSHSCDNVYKLLDDLEEHETKIRSSISLIFIASHGFFPNDVSQITLGEENLEYRISLSEMYAYNLHCLKKYPTVIFMNACHSGRLIKDNKNINNTDQRTGFATFFLERGSQGVIGTLGMVHNKYAAKISQSFFEEYKNNPNRSVAEIMRYLKQHSVKNFLAAKTEENMSLLLCTFMYIYYGNPMTRLKLISQEE
jgi:hypothetical protein